MKSGWLLSGVWYVLKALAVITPALRPAMPAEMMGRCSIQHLKHCKVGRAPRGMRGDRTGDYGAGNQLDSACSAAMMLAADQVQLDESSNFKV